MNSNYEPYYITEINVHINYSILESYIKNKKTNNNLSEEIIQKLEECRQKICNSKTYIELSKKQHLTSYSTSDRWKMINIKKNTLSNIFIIFNKLTADNLDHILVEMKEISLVKYDDFVKIADIFAGKSTLETDNLTSLINFLKQLNSYENWFVENNNYVYSFRELILITIQKEFVKLIDMAGDMEKRYVSSTVINDESTNEFVKKKKIILGLIKFLAELYNNQLFSNIVNQIILKKLYDEYIKNDQDIYLELFVVYFKYTFDALKLNDIDIYNSIIIYLHGLLDKNNQIASRISFIITTLLTVTNPDDDILDNMEIDDIENDDISILELDDQLEFLINEYNITHDFTELIQALEKKKFTESRLLDYIFKYLTSSVSILHNSDTNEIIKKILLKFNMTRDIVENKLSELMKDDDIICDLPLLDQIKIDNII